MVTACLNMRPPAYPVPQDLDAYPCTPQTPSQRGHLLLQFMVHGSPPVLYLWRLSGRYPDKRRCFRPHEHHVPCTALPQSRR